MSDQVTQSKGQKPSVMLVDDDKFLLDMYSLKFTQAGFVVYPCFSVEEALQHVRGEAKPDLILFDITMPGEDGFVLLQKLREEKLAPNAKLVALTNSDSDKQRAEEFGVARYVIKATMIPSEVVTMVKGELGIK